MSSNFDEALKLTLAKLKRSDRFESEVRDLLAVRYPEQAEGVVRWLKERRLLNERRTAEAYVSGHAGRHAVSSVKLLEDLQNRGVADDLARELVSEVDDDSAIRNLLIMKFKPLEQNRARAGRLLYSRGFDEDQITRALESFFSQPEPGSEVHRGA